MGNCVNKQSQEVPPKIIECHENPEKIKDEILASLDYLSREIADHWSGSERSARWGGIGKVRNEVRTSFGCDLAPDDPETLIFIIK